MRKQPMLTILFYLRSSKKCPDRAKIYCRVSLNGQRYTPFSTNLTVDPKHWKHQTTLNPADNEHLNEIREGIKALNRKMHYEIEAYTVADLVDTYLGKRDFNNTLLSVYFDFIGFKREQGRERSTIEVIDNYRKVLHSFVDETRKGILCRQIDVTFAQNFNAYLLQKGYAKSSIAKQITYLKSVLDYAILQGVIKYNPIKPYKIERPKPPKPYFLTNEELNRILHYDFTKNHIELISKRLDRIRDIFIVLRFLGVHWIDYTQLNDNNLYVDNDGDLIYHKERQKTKIETLSIVHPIVLSVIEKYKGVNNLPKISNQRFNDYLKIIFALAEIKKPASAKIGRKSFADHFTNVEPVNDSVLIKMLGLTSSKHLEYYRRVDIRAFKNHFKK